MLNLTGRVSRIITRPVAEGTPSEWIETTFVVEDWGQTLYVVKAKNFDGAIPQEGEQVILNVSVRAYVKKDGTPGYGLNAHGRAAVAAEPARRGTSAA